MRSEASRKPTVSLVMKLFTAIALVLLQASLHSCRTHSAVPLAHDESSEVIVSRKLAPKLAQIIEGLDSSDAKITKIRKLIPIYDKLNKWRIDNEKHLVEILPLKRKGKPLAYILAGDRAYVNKIQNPIEMHRAIDEKRDENDSDSDSNESSFNSWDSDSEDSEEPMKHKHTEHTRSLTPKNTHSSHSQKRNNSKHTNTGLYNNSPELSDYSEHDTENRHGNADTDESDSNSNVADSESAELHHRQRTLKHNSKHENKDTESRLENADNDESNSSLNDSDSKSAELYHQHGALKHNSKHENHDTESEHENRDSDLQSNKFDSGYYESGPESSESDSEYGHLKRPKAHNEEENRSLDLQHRNSNVVDDSEELVDSDSRSDKYKTGSNESESQSNESNSDSGYSSEPESISDFSGLNSESDRHDYLDQNESESDSNIDFKDSDLVSESKEFDSDLSESNLDLYSELIEPNYDPSNPDLDYVSESSESGFYSEPSASDSDTNSNSDSGKYVSDSREYDFNFESSEPVLDSRESRSESSEFGLESKLSGLDLEPSESDSNDESQLRDSEFSKGLEELIVSQCHENSRRKYNGIHGEYLKTFSKPKVETRERRGRKTYKLAFIFNR